MSGYQNKLHPLLLPNIVANIIKHFDDDIFLQNLRLVSRCWNEEACSLLRRMKIVEFCTESSVQQYNQIFGKTYEMFYAFPHSQYQLSFHIKRSNCETTAVLPEPVQEFLQLFRDDVLHLNLTIGAGHFEASLFNSILSELPNIMHLGLNFHYFNSYIPVELTENAKANLQSVNTLSVEIEGFELSEQNAMGFLFEMFECMENLRKLSFPGDIRRISKVGLLLRDAVLDSGVASLKRLSEWEFKTRLLEPDGLKLLCKDFPLKTLHIDLYNPDDDFDCMSSDLMSGLVLKWTNSLERLAIEFPWRKEVAFHFRFPSTMHNLTFLYLGGFEGVLLDLLRCLPQLKRLELSQLELMSILPKPDFTDVYPQVKQLRLDFCTGQTAGIISRFSRMFTELRSLNINHATNEVARTIFQKMGHLIRLRMHGDGLTDAGMCGFSESTVKENDLYRISPTQGSYYRKYPFVADLKELRYLKLDAYALTEITVRHGLVHSTSLQLVKMDSTGRADDSSTVCRTFKLSKYGKHLEEDPNNAVIEMKEEPPMEDEALEFFQSHDRLPNDLLNC